MSSPSPVSGNAPDKSRRKSLQRFVSKLVKGDRPKKNRSSLIGAAGPSDSSTATAPTATPTIIEAPSTAPATISTSVQPSTTEEIQSSTQNTNLSKPTSTTTRANEPAVVDAQSIAVDPLVEPVVEDKVIVRKPLSRGSGLAYSGLTPAERTRLIAQKHGVELTDEWPFPEKAVGQRVEKQIRMRVHRLCHRCDADFGAERVCPNCAHKRCKNCPRTPLKAEKVPKKKKKKDPYAGLTRPSRSGGQDLVHKTIRQRVHRKCHKCETSFGSEKDCPNCSHSRCKKCPRDPSKKKSTESKPDTHGRRWPSDWTCHECDSKLNKKKKCSNCGHEKCKECPREQSQKTTILPEHEPKSEAQPGGAETQPSIIQQIGHALSLTSIS